MVRARVILLLLVLILSSNESDSDSDCESTRGGHLWGKELYWHVDHVFNCGHKSLEEREGYLAEKCLQVRHGLLGNLKEINMDTIDQPEPTEKWTVLMMASFAGHNDLVKKLLENGANPDMKDRCGWTALMFSAFAARSTCVVQLLLEHHADTNLLNYRDQSALFIATEKQHTEIVQILLEHNANYRQRDIWDNYPISTGVYDYILERCAPEMVGVYLSFCYARSTATINAALSTAISHCCHTVVSDLLAAADYVDKIKILLVLAENMTKSCRHCTCEQCDCAASLNTLKYYSTGTKVTTTFGCLKIEDINSKNHCTVGQDLTTVKLALCIIIPTLLLCFRKHIFHCVMRKCRSLPQSPRLPLNQQLSPPPPRTELDPLPFSPLPPKPRLELDTPLCKVHLPLIKKYVQDLRKQDIVNIGTSLGLDFSELADVPADVIHATMISWWLERRHHVMEVSGVPTIKSLIEALKHQYLNGQVASIYRDLNFS